MIAPAFATPKSLTPEIQAASKAADNAGESDWQAWMGAGRGLQGLVQVAGLPQRQNTTPLGPLFRLEIRKKTFPQSGNNKQIIHFHNQLIEAVSQ